MLSALHGIIAQGSVAQECEPVDSSFAKEITNGRPAQRLVRHLRRQQLGIKRPDFVASGKSCRSKGLQKESALR